MTGQRIVHFTMTEAEARQHLSNLERAAAAADPPGQEALKALVLVIRREYEKASEPKS